MSNIISFGSKPTTLELYVLNLVEYGITEIQNAVKDILGNNHVATVASRLNKEERDVLIVKAIEHVQENASAVKDIFKEEVIDPIIDLIRKFKGAVSAAFRHFQQLAGVINHTDTFVTANKLDIVPQVRFENQVASLSKKIDKKRNGRRA